LVLSTIRDQGLGRPPEAPDGLEIHPWTPTLVVNGWAILSLDAPPPASARRLPFAGRGRQACREGPSPEQSPGGWAWS
jgi:hypothetical protein